MYQQHHQYHHPPGYENVPAYQSGQPASADTRRAVSGVGESPSDPVHWLLPTGRPWQSIVAGYVALFAWLIWPLGPVALGFGIWALVRASRQRGHGRGRAIFAVIVGALATAGLIAVVPLLL